LKVNFFPWGVEFIFPSVYATIPLTIVVFIELLNFTPSNGDQPHLYKSESFVTVDDEFGSIRTTSA